MNAERLRELAAVLLAENEQLALGSRLQELKSQLDNLTSNPGDANSQNQVAGTLTALEAAYRELESKLTPAQAQAIRRIGGWPYFSPDLPAGLRSLLAANGVTPSMVRDRVQQLIAERDGYLTRLTEASQSLAALGVSDELPAPGTAELGFLLPAALFNDTLEGLASEFFQLNKIIRVFSEIATGSVEEVQVRQISTTDPLIFLGMDVRTVALLAASVTWVLSTWKQGLEIRNIYDSAKTAKMPDKLLADMKSHIRATIDAEIEKHAKKLIGPSPRDSERANELHTNAKWALGQILAKIERGMTVEVRFLPPAKAANTGDEAEVGKADLQQEFSKLAKLAKELDFPAVVGEPLVPLEGPPPPDDAAA